MKNHYKNYSDCIEDYVSEMVRALIDNKFTGTFEINFYKGTAGKAYKREQLMSIELLKKYINEQVVK